MIFTLSHYKYRERYMMHKKTKNKRYRFFLQIVSFEVPKYGKWILE